MKPSARGGANWPPSSYDPETHLFYVCVADGAAAYSTKEGGVEWVMPHAGRALLRRRVHALARAAARRVRGARHTHEQPRVAAAVGRDVLRGHDRDGAAGSMFVGRNDGRLTALDKRERRSSSGSSRRTPASTRPSSTFEHDGQAVRRGAIGRHRVSRARRAATAFGCSRSTAVPCVRRRERAALGRRGGAHALARRVRRAGIAEISPSRRAEIAV